MMISAPPAVAIVVTIHIDITTIVAPTVAIEVTINKDITMIRASETVVMVTINTDIMTTTMKMEALTTPRLPPNHHHHIKVIITIIIIIIIIETTRHHLRKLSHHPVAACMMVIVVKYPQYHLSHHPTAAVCMMAIVKSLQYQSLPRRRELMTKPALKHHCHRERTSRKRGVCGVISRYHLSRLNLRESVMPRRWLIASTRHHH